MHHGPEARGFAVSHSDISNVTGSAFVHRYSAPEEVMVFPGSCLMCQKEIETRMYPTRLDKAVHLLDNLF